jgi:hypothetical protein
MLDARPMTDGRLVHRVAAPVGTRLMLARADGQNHAGPVSSRDDHVIRQGWAVQEVPLP